MVERYNRLRGVVLVGRDLKILKENVSGDQKQLWFWPVDTSPLGRLTLKRAAAVYFKSVFGTVVDNGAVSVVKTQKLKSIGSCRHEHFVLFVPPAGFTVSDAESMRLFEDSSMVSWRPHRIRVWSEVLTLACGQLGLSRSQSLAA